MAWHGVHTPYLLLQNQTCKLTLGIRYALQVSSNFAGHPLLAPRLLMSAARWNLCLLDAARRQRGDPDLCWCVG